jgi:hypothetical protein
MTEPCTGLRIEKMFAFVAIDPEDDNEGVCSVQLGDTHYPMVGADMAMVDKLRPYAEGLAKAGMTIRLVEFTTRTEVEVLSP